MSLPLHSQPPFPGDTASSLPDDATFTTSPASALPALASGESNLQLHTPSRRAMQEFGDALHVVACSLEHQFGELAMPTVRSILSTGGMLINHVLFMESNAQQQLHTAQQLIAEKQ